MNAINNAVTSLFDIFLMPFEVLGKECALVVVSGLFGILALFVFKYISNQKAIKGAKDKIKGHLIEVRLYQDDLGIFTKAIGKILLRNLQYVGYNFLPFVPLAIPFVFVLAQFVTRYAFAPLPVQTVQEKTLAGEGTVLQIELAKGHEVEISGLIIEYPDFIQPLSSLPVRAPLEGRAFQELVAIGEGRGEIALTLSDGTRVTKEIVAGSEAPRMFQPERVSGLLSFLWPAEDNLGDSAFAKVHFEYPDASLRWMPDGIFGVVAAFLIASIAFGLLVMKPLKVQI